MNLKLINYLQDSINSSFRFPSLDGRGKGRVKKKGSAPKDHPHLTSPIKGEGLKEQIISKFPPTFSQRLIRLWRSGEGKGGGLFNTSPPSNFPHQGGRTRMTISSILISILLSLIFISPAFAASSGTGGLMRVGTPAASSSSSAGPAVVVMPEEGSGPDAVVAHPPPPPPPPPPEPAPAEPEVGSLSSEPITCEGASVISIIITPRLISDYTAQHALIQRYFDDYLNPIYNHEGIIKLCFDITNSNPEARDENFLEINRAIRFSPSSRYPIFILLLLPNLTLLLPSHIK